MKIFNSLKILLFFTLIVSGLQAQQTSEKFIIETNYLLQLPEGYENDTTTQWPMMMFLHGVGECGSDVEKVKWLGPPAMIDRGHKYPFIVVSPQAPERGWNTDMLYKLIVHLKEKLRIDEERVYLTGLSMGGFGTWSMAQAHPQLFAAIIPICGGGSPESAWRITMPVWCFHGDQDDSVSIEYSQKMIEALERYDLNPNVKFTVYPGVGHDSWTETYNNPEVYEWMLAQKRFKYEEIELDTAILQEYAGRYGMDDYIFDIVPLENGRLRADMSNGDHIPFLLPAEKDKFFIDAYDALSSYVFERDENGTITKFVMVYGPYRTELEKVAE